MKVGDEVLDMHNERCVVASIDAANKTATIYNLRAGMYNPRICEIKDLRVVNESR